MFILYTLSYHAPTQCYFVELPMESNFWKVFFADAQGVYIKQQDLAWKHLPGESASLLIFQSIDYTSAFR